MNDRARCRRVIVLGSTGSIGTNSLDVIAHLRATGWTIELAGLAAGCNAGVLAEQARAHGVRHIAIADDSARAGLATALDTGTMLHSGEDGAEAMIRAIAQPGDIVIGAMVGSAGIPATVAAIERGCTIALANKETLVAAGALVMPLAKAHDVTILPVDSEHSAIFQCLHGGRGSEEIERLVLTASGGPFRTWSAERTSSATVAEALNHPTWTMGKKVTIDSATLMNKALEIIEAHWLFGVPSSKVEVLVHPASLVHSFVEFIDGSVLAQISPPDMRLPIQYALTWPDRTDGRADRVDWATFRDLSFEPVDEQRFGALQLARDVIDAGGTAGAIMNAANEIAVAAFLAGELSFDGITRLVGETLRGISSTPVRTMSDVMNADRAARAAARTWLETESDVRETRDRSAARTGVK
jgi:1-deoxy-D-xylulose-5-phosphate reductoisomerase